MTWFHKWLQQIDKEQQTIVQLFLIEHTKHSGSCQATAWCFTGYTTYTTRSVECTRCSCLVTFLYPFTVLSSGLQSKAKWHGYKSIGFLHTSWGSYLQDEQLSWEQASSEWTKQCFQIQSPVFKLERTPIGKLLMDSCHVLFTMLFQLFEANQCVWILMHLEMPLTS